MVAANGSNLANLKTTGLRKLLPEIAEVWRVEERPSLVDWSERTVRMPAETSAFPGPVDLRNRFPYAVGILEALDKPETQDATIMASSQIGKTITMLLAMLGLGQLSPSPAMLVTPDRPSMIEMRDRAYAMCDESPALAAVVPPEYRRNDLYLDLGKTLVHLAFSGNKQRLSSKSCRRVYMTEVDRYKRKKTQRKNGQNQGDNEGDTMALAAERVKMFPQRLVVRESTPTIKGESRIANAYYDESDRRTFRIPCPHCGEFQRLAFTPDRQTGRGGIQGLRDATTGNLISPERALSEAWYQCAHCGERITDQQKAVAMRRGVWCPEGCVVDRDGKLQGKPLRSARHVGFHLSTLYAPPEAITFGQVAAKYLECYGADGKINREKYQSFRNNWLGLTYEPNAEAIAWQVLRNKLTIPIADGVAHPEAVFLTLGADVQGSEVFWTVRAWWVRNDEPTSCRVAGGVFKPLAGDDGQTKRNSDLDQLDDVLSRAWPTADGRTLRVQLACIDTNHRTQELYRWLRARAAKRIRGVRGDNRAVVSGFRKTTVDTDANTGKAADQGLALWLIATNAYTDDLFSRWPIPADEPGAWSVNEGAPELYWRQLTNASVIEEHKPDGSVVKRVVERDHGLRSDFLDTEVYNAVAAEMIVGADWSKLPAMAAQARAAEALALQQKAAPSRPREKPVPRHVREREGGWTRR